MADPDYAGSMTRSGEVGISHALENDNQHSSFWFVTRRHLAD